MPSSPDRPDAYNYPRRLELALRNLKQNSKVSETNRQRILGFHEMAVAEGLSKPRLIRYINILSRSAELLGSMNFTDAKKDDIVSLVAKIEASPVLDWTKQSYKLVLRKFYKWLRHSKGYPREVSWIRGHVSGRNSIRRCSHGGQIARRTQNCDSAIESAPALAIMGLRLSAGGKIWGAILEVGVRSMGKPR